MTRSSYRRICALLAAAGVRHSEFVEFMRAAMSRGNEGVYQDISRLRGQLHLEADEGHARPNVDTPLSDELAEKVQRLLFGEAHLTKTEAFDLLSSEVRKRHPHIDVPLHPKKGFAAWVRKLAAVVPESDLLHLATTIRNSFVHQNPHDWQLK